MEINKIIKRTQKIKGFLKEGQMRVIYPFIRDMDANGLLVEIGTYHGRSTHFFSLVNPKIKILTIDALSTDNKEQALIDPKVISGSNIFQVIGKSYDILATFNWTIDTLFVDGDHSHEATLDDLVGWSVHLRVGGYIIVDDYNEQYWPGVVSATDKFIGDNMEYTIVVADKDLHLCIIKKNCC